MGGKGGGKGTLSVLVLQLSKGRNVLNKRQIEGNPPSILSIIKKVDALSTNLKKTKSLSLLFR
ncbi:hypothetical protein Q75_11905 [Bacillus coahuilensis p1.1.43]|uniref:Uncharacterized protein n=1 Tax=Bacillus coahuilensis p1.1.43 TaxID=1150625 RepID=A0A147K6L6_9BACI|nr:hypothetical protein Q75_11905 [Bacillus coahuilensis p1.1.43]